MTLAPLRRSGDGRPRFGHSPAAGPDATSGREPAPGAGHSSPLFAAPGGLASRHTSWSGRARLAPRPRGSAKRSAGFFAADSAALLFPRPRSVSGGFGWGRALGCGTRPNPPRAQPRLRSAFVPTRYAVRTHLRAPHKTAEDGGFALALVRPRLPRPFFVQNRSLWGRKWPPRRNFARKTAPEGAARPPATRPEPFRCAKNSGPLAFGVLPARRGLMTAPVTVPTAQARSGLGSGLRPSAVRSLNPRTYFNSPLSRSSLRPQRPRFA